MLRKHLETTIIVNISAQGAKATAVDDMDTLSVRGPSLDVRISRFQTSDSDV